MSKHWNPTKKSKYYVPKETFLTAVHYCKQYPLWLAELALTTDNNRAIRYDIDRVQTSGDTDPTMKIAVRRMAIEKKKKKVDDVAKAVAGDLDQWIIQGVCYDLTYYQLQQRGSPCGKDLYYSMRRKFYFMIAKEI